MGTRFTRRRFLTAVSAGATYLGLTNMVGCELAGRTSKVRPLPSDSSASARAASVFRSRPDLSPPTIEVTAQAHSRAAGYVFVGPEGSGAGQGGSMIVDDRGQMVWFRPMRSGHGRVMNFKVQTYRGRPVLTWGETPGEYVIFDDTYREIARLRAANGYNGDHHEFLISPQDTALITIYNAVPWDLSSVGGPKDSVAWQGIVQELDIETGKVLFEWHSRDHVGLEETYVEQWEENYPGIDYFHINSIDVDHDNNLLVSARETSTVYKIDRNTGEVIWRLGGKQSDFVMGPGTRFAFQHDARRLPDGTITVFDNGILVFEGGIRRAEEEARAIVLQLDEEQMTASLVRQYTHPDKQYAEMAGNVQVLPNTNVFIGWGRALTISEFSKDGEMLFDARLLPQNKSYRAFRFPWSAHPRDQPAAAAERYSEDEIRVYASWNGATEIATWEVLAGPDPEDLRPVGSVPRNDFETAVMVRTPEPYVGVRAKHRSGRVLGSSQPVAVGN